MHKFACPKEQSHHSLVLSIVNTESRVPECRTELDGLHMHILNIVIPILQVDNTNHSKLMRCVPSTFNQQQDWVYVQEASVPMRNLLRRKRCCKAT